MFCFPKISRTPVCMFLPFVNDIHTLWGAGGFQFGIKIQPEKSVLGDFFFIRNLSTNICHFCLKKCIFQGSGFATGPKVGLLQSVCLLVSKVAGYFHNGENYFFLTWLQTQTLQWTFLFYFPQLSSGTYSNKVLRKKKRQVRHVESDQCLQAVLGVLQFWLLEGW